MHRLWPVLEGQLSLKPDRKSSNVQVKLYRKILQVKKLAYVDITHVLGAAAHSQKTRRLHIRACFPLFTSFPLIKKKN